MPVELTSPDGTLIATGYLSCAIDQSIIAVYSSFGFVIEKTITGVMPGNEEFAVKVHVMKWVDNAGNKQMLWDI